MGQVEVLWDGDGVPPRQMDTCENIPSRHTTYVVSENYKKDLKVYRPYWLRWSF